VVRLVVNDVINETLLFTTDDPTGDDNGPGTYHRRPRARST
jgi:hypothetical protein